MTQALKQLWTLTYLNYLETIRNKILLLALFFMFFMVCFSVLLSDMSVFELSRIIIDMGLFTASAFGGVVTVLMCCASLSNDLQQRTAYLLLTKPIHRSYYLVGKYIGLVMALFTLTSIIVLSTALMVYLSYGAQFPEALWLSIGTIGLEIMIVAALSLFFATITPSLLLATSYSIAVFIAGHTSSEWIKLLESKKKLDPLLLQSAKVLNMVLPDLQVMSLRTEAANFLPIPAGLIEHAAAYGITYSALILYLTILIFNKRKML